MPGVPYVCTLSKKSLKKAELELNERTDERFSAIETFRTAVLGYPGLTCPTDDAFLLRFLRGRKFDQDRALQLVVQHYRVKNQFPEVFTDLRPSAFGSVEKSMHFFNPLPHKDKHGRTIVWRRGGLWDIDVCSFNDYARIEVMVTDHMLEDEETQVNGVAYIVDFKDVTMSKAYHASTSAVRRLFAIIQDSTPLRVKAMHLVNEHSVVSYLLPIVKMFMKPKIASRIFSHGTDLTSLHEHFSPDILPPDLGGTMVDWPEYKHKWITDFLSTEEKLVEMAKYKLVEDTPGMKGEDVKGDALQGMSGTFRKIEH